MQSENRLFDDLARVASGAAGTLAGLRTEIELLVRQRFERLIADMDLVSREEFDAVKVMAAKARDEQDALAKRLDDIEKRLAGAPPSDAKPAAPRRRRKGAGKATEKTDGDPA